MMIIFILIYTSYFVCLGFLIFGFKKLPVFNKTLDPKTRFSIVIPFRNESENLSNLLESLLKLNYLKSRFQVLLINDKSEDNSEEIVQNYISKSKIDIRLIQNIRNSNSPKKDAISTGIKNADFEWILSTDADCEVPGNWLICYDSEIQKSHSKMICGPVLYTSKGNFLEDFQQLDGLSLQTVTAGSFGLKKSIMANGANLGFEKQAFYDVNGFQGNDHLASGDDIFLMEKIKKKFSGKLSFLKSKEALVKTKPQESLNLLINQRIRWASKTSKQKNIFSLTLGLLVFFTNLLILISPVFMIFYPENTLIYLGLISGKLLFDYIFIRQSAIFYGLKIKVISFLISFIVYPLIIFFVVIKSLNAGFSWKGRFYSQQN